MKKLFLALVFATLSFGLFAQNGFVPVYVVADSSTKFNRVLEIGTPVYCVSLNKFYVTKVRIGTTNTYTVGWLLGSTSRYTQPDFASSTTLSTDNATVNDTLFVGGTTNYIFENTTNGMKVPNSWTVTDTTISPVVSASTKVLIGAQTIVPTNTNKATFNNSLGVTDTLFVGGTANYVFQNTVNGLKVPNSITVTDSVFVPVASINSVPLKTLTSKIYADSLATKRIVISDTLQGVVLYSAAGTKYRLRVTAAGNLTLVAVP